MNETDLVFYGPFAPALTDAEARLVSQLQALLDGISTDPELRPAEHLAHRIKGADSLKEKMRRQGLTPDPETALRTLHDIIGVRLVVHFIGDVYALRDAISACPHWQVDAVRDYIARPKPNGYRSLHMLLTMPFAGPGLPEIRAEIQLRTIAMDCWASLDHQLRYKKTISHADLLGQELSRCAAEMASTDLTLQTIREMLAKEN